MTVASNFQVLWMGGSRLMTLGLGRPHSQIVWEDKLPISQSVWEDNFYRRGFPQWSGKTDFKVQCHSAHKPPTEQIDRIEK